MIGLNRRVNMSLLQEIEQHGLADCEFNRKLTGNQTMTPQEKFQQAFIAAIGRNGIPEEAAQAFMENGDDDEFYAGKYGEYYTTLQDCYNVWRDANLFMRDRCYGICENIGTEGDGQNCADEISRIKIDGTE
jgi:hypothetical protein